MLLQEKANYVKAAEIKQGVICKIIGEGQYEEMAQSKYKNEDGSNKFAFFAKVELNGEEKKLKFNSASLEECKKAWGKETKAWIGKEATLNTYPTPVGKTIGITPIVFEE